MSEATVHPAADETTSIASLSMAGAEAETATHENAEHKLAVGGGLRAAVNMKKALSRAQVELKTNKGTQQACHPRLSIYVSVLTHSFLNLFKSQSDPRR